ncbi:MAG: C10 family peptidase [Bacteroidota bacterium]
MKKNIALFLICIIGMSISISAKKVELPDAKLVGKNFYYEVINRVANTDYSSLMITKTYVEGENDTPFYYVFTINNNGFIIISAEDACYPVLGYSFNSTYSTENQPENFKAWMNKYKEEIKFVIQNTLPANENIRNAWQSHHISNVNSLDNLLVPTDVAPLLTSNWDQIGPYNLMCPPDASGPSGHVLVGCVATAMAQVMYYWRYPMTGQGSHCDYHYYNGQQYCADFGNSTYDWNGAADQPSKTCDPVALISYHAGIAVNMQYGPTASGAYSSDIPIALKNYFRYSNTTYSQSRTSNYTSWTNQIKSDLDAKRPVIYSGHGPDGGHCFVCDGYQGTDMFHFNWGWSGSSNGYFNINNLNPGGYTFNSGQEAVFNIQPDPAQYPYNCAGLTNVTTYGFGTIEDGSGPVANYQNNENCSWLIGVDDSVQNIKLSFERFNTDAADIVNVYDGPTTSCPLLGSYSGSAIPPNITSTAPQILVTFTTNGSTTSDGWLASYTTNYVHFCESLTTLTDLQGTIIDGSNRFQYRNSNICKWQIIPDCYNIGSTTLTFDSFSTEQTKDKVQVYDLIAGTLLGTFSGTYTTMPAPVTSNSGKMYIVFSTDPFNRGDGWSAHYTVDCLNVGVEEKSISGLSIYPNPASQFLNIEFSLNETQLVKLEMISGNGQTLYSETLRSAKGQINKHLDVASWAQGVYMLRITTDKETTSSKVIIR